MKGWCITIFAAFLAIYADKSNPIFLYIAIVPTLLFWILDSNYLTLERRYRKLYDHIIEPMNEKNILFSMNVNQYKNGNCNFFKVMFFSWSITLLYSSIIAGFIIFGLFSYCVFSTS